MTRAALPGTGPGSFPAAVVPGFDGGIVLGLVTAVAAASLFAACAGLALFVLNFADVIHHQHQQRQRERAFAARMKVRL